MHVYQQDVGLLANTMLMATGLSVPGGVMTHQSDDKDDPKEYLPLVLQVAFTVLRRKVSSSW